VASFQITLNKLVTQFTVVTNTEVGLHHPYLGSPKISIHMNGDLRTTT